MTTQAGLRDRATPFSHALWGVVVLAIGGMPFVNLNEPPGVFVVFAMFLSAPGLYLLIVGAVARGIALARSG